MPEYLVRFDQRLDYQPDHPKAKRVVDALCVNSHSPEGAVTHALRVTRGPGTVISVRLVEETDEEAASVRMQVTAPVPIGPVEGEPIVLNA